MGRSFGLGAIAMGIACLGGAWVAQASSGSGHGETGYTVLLEPGWNLVVAPFTMDSLPKEWTEGAQAAQATVWPGGTTERREPAASLVAGEGYWVHVQEAQSFTWGQRPVAAFAALEPGWDFFFVDSRQIYRDPLVDRVLEWDAASQVYRSVRIGDPLEPGKGYWRHFASSQAVGDPQGPPRVEAPRRPSIVSAVVHDLSVALAWRAPSIFASGREIPEGSEVTHRVYRDGVLIKEVAAKRFEDVVPLSGRPYDYAVATVFRARDGTVLESTRSASVPVEVSSLEERVVPGAFESAGVLAEPSGPTALPSAALSASEGSIFGHVVHVVRDPKRGDSIWYARSAKAGQSGSFDAGRVLDRGQSGWTVAELVVAARADRVGVAWIEAPAQASKGATGGRLWITESADGGLSFSPRTLVRESPRFQRGLDMGYDRVLDHHLVWGDGGKVYYLKNLEGEVSNVFDVRRREKNTEQVRYLAQYPPQDGQCACTDCWCEDSHPLSQETDDEGRPLGPYREWIEERAVSQPSLSIDDEKVTIVGRQTRMWDNKSVPNKAWLAMAESPVYSDTIVQGSLPTRFVAGWRKTWKTAYEPGDEALLGALGFQAQYLYEGTWHEQDEIQVAQRPLVAGAWEQAPADGVSASAWKQGAWQDGVFQNWRISSAGMVGEGEGDGMPSYPRVASAPYGLVLVYEDGVSDDPNLPESNPIQLRASNDGGLTWSEPRTVGLGYLPQVGTTDAGDLAVLFYTPKSPQGGAIEARRSIDGGASFAPSALVSELARPIHWKSHGAGGDALRGRVALATHENLFFAVWVEAKPGLVGGDRVVGSRASYVSEVVAYDVALPETLTRGQSAQVTVTAENTYHMRVESPAKVALVRHLSRSFGTHLGSSGAAVSPSGPVGDGVVGSSPSAGVAEPAAGLELSFVAGQAQAWVDPEGLSLVSDRGVVHLADMVADASSFPGAHGAALVEDGSESRFGPEIPRFEASAAGNYKKAQWMQKKLFHYGPHDWTADSVAYQIEYEASDSDPIARAEASRWLAGAFEEGRASDNQYLAGFERVWAYTQGIALANLSQQGTPRSEDEAQAMARYLCAHAEFGVVDGKHVNKGWPFSWNTKGDDWKDVRLVTGASAWVVHGLGVYLTSSAFRNMDRPLDEEEIQACYRMALDGLEVHRHVGTIGGARVSLMTAGFTTRGLDQAATPWNIKGEDGQPVGLKNELWDYYDVLDALGYETFDEERPPEIARQIEVQKSGQVSVEPSGPRTLTEREFGVLKEEVRAKNVVTEHNLDVLSVLNHAIDHAEALGLDPHRLQEWRDELREGIFRVLWDQDERLWRSDLEGALAAAGADFRNRSRIEEALNNGDWGRVSTGGIIVTSSEVQDLKNGRRLSRDGVLDRLQAGAGSNVAEIESNRETLHFLRSAHVAIDNCSWLSLSVDYEDLTDQDKIDDLGRCLEFTTLAFAKELEVGPKRYYGTHYFFNEFEDRYISASGRQEQSYHLEATAGLILGLLQFAEHQPSHPKSAFFKEEALALWAGVQDFVLDYGFPYSSERIQDLSTRLTSSTALIWFMDVYEHIHAQTDDLQRPLRHYGMDLLAGSAATFVVDSYARLKTLTSTETGLIRSSGPDGVPFTRVDEQAMAVIVATNREDWAMADVWVRGLLKTQVGPPEQKEFPSIVDSRDGLPLLGAFRHTGVQMAVYYALGRYLDPSLTRPRGQSVLESEVRGVLHEGLKTMKDLYWEPYDPSTEDHFHYDMFLKGAPDFEQPRFQVSDNVFAYFAYQQAERLGLDGHHGARSMGRFEEMLADECEQGVISTRSDRAAGSALAANAGESRPLPFCVAFLTDIGRVEEALNLLPGVTRAREERTAFLVRRPIGDRAPKNTFPLLPGDALWGSDATEDWLRYAELDHVSRPHLWGQLIQEGFGHRALASIDPRQEELALEEYHWLTSLSGDSAFYHIAALLLHDPKGAFGVDAGPLFMVPEWPEPKLLRMDAEAPLGRLRLDAVRTLLVSEVSPFRFDALLDRVALVDFVLAQIDNNAPLSDWRYNFSLERDEWRLRADAFLSNLCEHAPFAEHVEDYESYFGLPCQDLSALYKALRTKRFGTPDDFPLSLVSESEPYLVSQFLGDLKVLMDHDWYMVPRGSEGDQPEDPSCVTCTIALGPVDNSDEPTASQLQRRMQQALIFAYDHRFERTTAFDKPFGDGPFRFSLRGMDSIDAYNPGAPSFWSERALVLRAIADHARSLSFDPPLPLRALRLPPSETKGDTVRRLRERINREWDGRITAAAEASGNLPGILHRWMQTGELYGAPNRESLGLHLSSRIEPKIVGATDDNRTLEIKPNTCRRYELYNNLSDRMDWTVVANGSSEGARFRVVLDDLRHRSLEPGETGSFRFCLEIDREYLSSLRGPLHQNPVGWFVRLQWDEGRLERAFRVELTGRDVVTDSYRDIEVVGAFDGRVRVPYGGCRRLEVINRTDETLSRTFEASVLEGDEPPSDGGVLRIEETAPQEIPPHGRVFVTACYDAPAGELSRGRVLETGWALDALHGDGDGESFSVDALVDGLVGHWSLDNHAEERSRDWYVMEPAFVGSVPVWRPGWVGAGLRGGSVFYVPVADGEYTHNHDFLETSEAFSISLWLARPARSGAGTLPLVGNRGPENLDPGWALTLGSEDHLELNLVSASGESFTAVSVDPVLWTRGASGGADSANDLWAHVTVTWDGKGAVGMFVDGQPLATHQTATDGFGPLPLPNTYGFRVGWPDVGSGPHAPGGIDELRLYRGVVTEGQIRALAATPSTPGGALLREGAEVLFDFEVPSQDPRWSTWSPPLGQRVMPVVSGGRRGLLIDHPNVRSETFLDGGEQIQPHGYRDTSAQDQWIMTNLKPRRTGIQALSMEVTTLAPASLGHFVQTRFSDDLFGETTWSDPVALRSQCTRVVFPVDVVENLVFLFTAPEDSGPDGVHGRYVIDNITLYHQDAPSLPGQGEPCTAFESVAQARRGLWVDAPFRELGWKRRTSGLMRFVGIEGKAIEQTFRLRIYNDTDHEGHYTVSSTPGFVRFRSVPVGGSGPKPFVSGALGFEGTVPPMRGGRPGVVEIEVGVEGEVLEYPEEGPAEDLFTVAYTWPDEASKETRSGRVDYAVEVGRMRPSVSGGEFLLAAPGQSCADACNKVGQTCVSLGSVGLECGFYTELASCNHDNSTHYRARGPGSKASSPECQSIRGSSCYNVPREQDATCCQCQPSEGEETPESPPWLTGSDFAFCARVDTVPTLECQTLVSLYRATHGENWKPASTPGRVDWLASDDPCQWEGIHCSQGRVSEISLWGQGLEGGTSLPDLKAFEELYSLNIGGNDLTHIPSSWVSLTTLRELNLRNVDLFSFPMWVTGLPELIKLDLSYNKIPGPIPPELGQLTKLKSLNLSHNRFTDRVPSEIWALDLLDLNLEENPLEGPLSLPSSVVAYDRNDIETHTLWLLGTAERLAKKQSGFFISNNREHDIRFDVEHDNAFFRLGFRASDDRAFPEDEAQTNVLRTVVTVPAEGYVAVTISVDAAAMGSERRDQFRFVDQNRNQTFVRDAFVRVKDPETARLDATRGIAHVLPSGVLCHAGECPASLALGLLDGQGVTHALAELTAGSESTVPSGNHTKAVLSFGLGQSGHTYVGMRQGGAGAWVDVANLPDADFRGPDEQGFFSFFSRLLNPGTVMSVAIRNGAPNLVRQGADDVARAGPQAIRVGTPELMTGALFLSTLVGFSFGSAHTWTTLVQLDAAPNGVTEPWVFVGHVEEHEVTTLFGLALKDEAVIRDQVQISQVHAQGGFSTPTVNFEPGAIYGLVKKVHNTGAMLPWNYVEPTGEPVAVYRLMTDLTPEEMEDAVLKRHPGWAWFETVAQSWSGQGVAPNAFLDGLKGLILQPSLNQGTDFPFDVNVVPESQQGAYLEPLYEKIFGQMPSGVVLSGDNPEGSGSSGNGQNEEQKSTSEETGTQASSNQGASSDEEEAPSIASLWAQMMAECKNGQTPRGAEAKTRSGMRALLTVKRQKDGSCVYSISFYSQKGEDEEPALVAESLMAPDAGLVEASIYRHSDYDYQTIADETYAWMSTTPNEIEAVDMTYWYTEQTMPDVKMEPYLVFQKYGFQGFHLHGTRTHTQDGRPKVFSVLAQSTVRPMQFSLDTQITDQFVQYIPWKINTRGPVFKHLSPQDVQQYIIRELKAFREKSEVDLRLLVKMPPDIQTRLEELYRKLDEEDPSAELLSEIEGIETYWLIIRYTMLHSVEIMNQINDGSGEAVFVEAPKLPSIYFTGEIRFKDPEDVAAVIDELNALDEAALKKLAATEDEKHEAMGQLFANEIKKDALNFVKTMLEQGDPPQDWVNEVLRRRAKRAAQE